MWEWIAKLGYTYRVRTGFDERIVTVEPHHVKVGIYLGILLHKNLCIPPMFTVNPGYKL